jgi:hypothetical protein
MTIDHSGWTIYRGGVREWDIDFTDEDTNLPRSLAGARITYVLAQSLAGPPLIRESDPPVINIIDQDSGSVRIKLDGTHTGDLPYGRVVHQIIVADLDSDAEVALEGHGEVLPMLGGT